MSVVWACLLSIVFICIFLYAWYIQHKRIEDAEKLEELVRCTVRLQWRLASAKEEKLKAKNPSDVRDQAMLQIWETEEKIAENLKKLEAFFK